VENTDVSETGIQEKYDVIIFSYVLHHIANERAVALIQEAKMHTNSGGLNIVTAFTKDGDFYAKDKNTERFYPDGGEWRSFYNDWNIHNYEEGKTHAFAKHPDGSHMVNVAAELLAQRS
jgi:hypothetical protein